LDVGNAQGQVFPAGTRTGDWLAVGDREPVAVSSPPPGFDSNDVSHISGGRRSFVRLVGCIAIAGTLFCLISLAMHAPARRAILHWGLFGRSDRIAQTMR
jgi:hypothetical protein